jgi:two-component sensor histidine kinase
MRQVRLNVRFHTQPELTPFGQAGLSTEVLAAFNGRLHALSRAQNTITQVNWEAAALADIVAGAIDACSITGRVASEGPPVLLKPQAAVTFAMALHELATNAMKYGALSNDRGHVVLDWALDSEHDGQLRVCWREVGGPKVSQPQRRGFGSRLLDRVLAGELKGKVQIDYLSDGVVCTIIAPASTLATSPVDQV